MYVYHKKKVSQKGLVFCVLPLIVSCVQNKRRERYLEREEISL